MLPDLTAKEWLGLTVVGAAVSTLGALVGILLKDYFFSRSFERWKQEQILEALYQKYRDPLILAGRELASRCREIAQEYPTVYLNTTTWRSKPPRQVANNTDDPYFRRYKLTSSLYRLAAFLGWLELYRQDITHLRPQKNEHSKALDRAIESIRSDLADGQINRAQDWKGWRDTLVFREELRAIGESMIEVRGSARTVMGYGRFIELVEAASASTTQRWAAVLGNFLLDLDAVQPDFRRTRIERLVVHLVDMMLLLDPNAIDPSLVERREELATKHGL